MREYEFDGGVPCLAKICVIQQAHVQIWTRATARHRRDGDVVSRPVEDLLFLVRQSVK